MTTQSRMFARSARSVGKARDFVAARVRAGDRADDIRVCVSELVTNALRHTPAGHLFLVRVLAQEHLVRVEVHDAGGGEPRVCAPADTDDRGRGLRLPDQRIALRLPPRRMIATTCRGARLPGPVAAAQRRHS